MGSSFCRLSRVKLQNEDPRLEAKTHDATRRRDRLLQQIASCEEDPRLNALLDVN